jgi:hypothetical protein
VLDVPCNTQIRDLGETVAAGHRRPPWRRVDEWAQAQPPRRWRKVHLGAGSKGPKVVCALEGWVQVKDEDGHVGGRERVVVIRTVDREPQCWYTLTNAAAETALPKLVEVHSRRHGVEELFAVGKGEVGLSHYEVRSWVGWHHHMTLTMLALWFLQLERNRLGGKNPGLNSAADARNIRSPVASEPSQRGTHRRRSQHRAAPERRDAHLPLVCENA